MPGGDRTGRLAVILHADVAGSTALVQQNEQLAHERIQATFQRFGATIGKYHGYVRELRGDALLGEFERASDAVTAALAFQADQARYTAGIDDGIKPEVRVGIAMGEVIVADDTITGAGVVLAQRIEQLTEPGGVGIQGAAYETIPGRFPFEYESLGEHEVKGFDNPVRLFSASLKQDTDIPPPSPRTRRARGVAFALAALIVIAIGAGLLWLKPRLEDSRSSWIDSSLTPSADTASVVVLPFDNLSGDASQKYLADGITEDITTDLSRVPNLFVIARNSAFAYQDKTIDPKEVSRDLGVRYVLEGSVRRVGDLLRINVQLIDGKSGGHLWANRYDGTTDKIFEFQDSVIENVVSSLSLKLDADRHNRFAQSETTNPDAYDAFLQGWAHYVQRTPADYVEAASHFKHAVALDPEYSRAYAALAATYWEGWERWWYKQLGFDEWNGPREEAVKYLETAMMKPTALAHQVASEVYRQQDRHADMVREANAAVQMDPNDPFSYVALSLALLLDGDAEGALEAADRALILDPQNPAYYLYLKGMASFSLERYEQAADYLERAMKLNPANFSANNFLIPTYAHLGRIDAAKERVAKHPLPMSLDWMAYSYRFKNPEDWARYAEGMHLAGVPDVATKLPRPPED
jgi:TolB-like protein/class 3 adenylate cyclase